MMQQRATAIKSVKLGRLESDPATFHVNADPQSSPHVQFSRDAKLLVCCDNQSFNVYDVVTRTELWSRQIQEMVEEVGMIFDDHFCRELAWSLDSEHLVVCYPPRIEDDGFIKQVQLLSVSAQSGAVALGHALSLTVPVQHGFEDSLGRRTPTWNAQLSPDSSFLAAAVLGQAPKAFHEDARFLHWSIMHTTSGRIVLSVPVINAATGWTPCCSWSPVSTHLVTNCGMLADLSSLSVSQLRIPGLADKELSGLAFDDVGRLIGCNSRPRLRADPDQHAAEKEPAAALVIEATSGTVLLSLTDAKIVGFSRRNHVILE